MIGVPLCARSLVQNGECHMNGNPPLDCHRPAVYIQQPDGKWLK
ncbi:unnamed protein product [Staurois parvus]|uniref:Uncharacterized protein n=1 Tax=Staurois parvus TaxID=386267 RepID=A0ABN9ACE0_9NEOB|nr:unnamed protein product [Staurois parvus]